MKATCALASILFLSATGCFREEPVRIVDQNLGVAAVFPGQPRLHKFMESTPFGEMEWFSTTYETPGRLDRSFFVNVGNLPPGDQGGTTEPAVMASMRQHLTAKMGLVEVDEMPPAKGSRFRYTAKLPYGEMAEGIVVVKRGRVHWAQGTAARVDDPQLRLFVEGFEVLP